MIYDYLRASAHRSPDKVALVCDDKRYTYRDIFQYVEKFGSLLAVRGIRTGECVIIFSDNTMVSVAAFWAVVRCGGVVSFVSPLIKAEKLAYIVSNCNAVTIVAESQHYETVSMVLKSVDTLRNVFLTNGDWYGSSTNDQRIERLDETVTQQNRIVDDVRPVKNELVAVIYTSGSSGDPKGVMITHGNMDAATHSITSYLEMRDDDVVINFLPMSFDYGLYQMIMSFFMGAKLVLERSFLYPSRIVRLIVDESVTALPGVPAIFSILIDMNKRKELLFPSVRFVTNTADVLPVAYIPEIKRIFPNAKIFSMYGLTECKRCSYLPPDDIDRKPESVGIPIPGTLLNIVDNNGKLLGPDETGELVVSSDTVMQGYLGMKDATGKVLRSVEGIEGKVLFTGDLCRFDDEGYLYVLGRKDDVFKVGGEKVAPKEVERVIASINGVLDVHVYGAEDATLGHIVKVKVVVDESLGLVPADILGECSAKLENFMVPRIIEFVDKLPRSDSFKLSLRSVNK